MAARRDRGLTVYLPALVLAAQGAAPVTPDHLCRVALAHKTQAVAAMVGKGLSRADAEYEVSHWYYLAWNGWPAERLATDRRSFNWHANNLHFAADAIDLAEVPGSGGLLVWFDRRQPGWGAEAVSAVFNRDTVFRQPGVGESVASLLRASVNRKVNAKTLHVEAVAWAPRIYRDTLETQRAASYYDLLFSAQRFGNHTEHRDPKHAGYFTNDRGRTWVERAKLPKVDPNFPATLDDWEGLFKRQSKATATAFGKPIQFGNLAVVAGHQDDPLKGSFVSRAGRAVKIEQGDFGPVMETLDVKEQVGDRNLLEFAPRLAAGEEPKVDAYETLAGLPAGALAKALWDGDRKRVEIADGNIARGVQKPVTASNVLAQHSNVRNGVMDCDRCHAPSYGLIEPRDLVKDVFDARNARGDPATRLDFFKDPADLVQFRAAYGRLKETIPGHQARYKSLVERTTKGADGKPWAPRELVDAIEGFVHTYDSAVGKTQAAAELGVPVPVLERVASKTLTAQEKALIAAAGSIPVPRPTWDADVRPRLVDVLVSEYPGEIHRGHP